MTTPPPLPGTTNRDALTRQLDDLRTTAGLTENALARQMRVVQSRVWKILHDGLLPNEADIRTWTRVTGRPELADELIALLVLARSEQVFAREFRRKGGGAAYQDYLRELEAQVTRVGWFEVAVVPGLLQTADYARQVLSMETGPRAWGNDDRQIEAMVDSRLRGQEILHNPAKRLQVVLGEGALRNLLVTPDVLIGQLGKLLSVLRLPSLELGIIGFDKLMPAFPLTFRVIGDELVITETIVDEHQHTEPEQVAVFLRAFDQLREAASYGEAAAAIIQRVINDLRGQ